LTYTFERPIRLDLKTCISISLDGGDLVSSGIRWDDAVMLTSKTIPSEPKLVAKDVGISGGGLLADQALPQS
jgi:hypothetical protein